MSAGDIKTELEIRKLEADLRKAELEVLELTRWYRRPVVFQSVAAIVIGLSTALAGICSGWFSTKLESLKNQQVAVQNDIDALSKGKLELSKRNEELTAQTVALTAQVNALEKQLAEAAQLVPALGAKSSENAALRAQIAKIQQTLRGPAVGKTFLIHGIIASIDGTALSGVTVTPHRYFCTSTGEEEPDHSFPPPVTTGKDGAFSFFISASHAHERIVLDLRKGGASQCYDASSAKAGEDLRITFSP